MKGESGKGKFPLSFIQFRGSRKYMAGMESFNVAFMVKVVYSRTCQLGYLHLTILIAPRTSGGKRAIVTYYEENKFPVILFISLSSFLRRKLSNHFGSCGSIWSSGSLHGWALHI